MIRATLGSRWAEHQQGHDTDDHESENRPQRHLNMV